MTNSDRQRPEYRFLRVVNESSFPARWVFIGPRGYVHSDTVIAADEFLNGLIAEPAAHIAVRLP
jgi:hypothetical protein